MCKTLIKFKEYYDTKYNLQFKFNKIIIFTTIIENIYNHCKDIFKLNNTIDRDNIPSEFKNYIKKYKNQLYDYDYILWIYIFSIIKFLINNISTPTLFNVEKILYKTELLISRNNKCIEILIDKNNKLNCIISAIKNVLVSIVNIDEQKDKFISAENLPDLKLGKLEVELAVSIILNTKKIINIDDITYDDEFLKSIITEHKMYEDEEQQYTGLTSKIEIPVFNEETKEFEFREDDKLYEDIEEEEESEEEEDYEQEESEGDEEEDYGDLDGADKKSVRFKEDNKKYNPIYVEELSEYLKINKIFEDVNYKQIAKLILNGANFIENYKQISEKNKNNRINFFGTLI